MREKERAVEGGGAGGRDGLITSTDEIAIETRR